MTLPADVSVVAEGRGEQRRVVLNIEGTTFDLHPDDAKLIGAALIDVAAEAEAEPPQDTGDTVCALTPTHAPAVENPE